MSRAAHILKAWLFMDKHLTDRLFGWTARMAEKAGLRFDFCAWSQKSFSLHLEKLKIKSQSSSESLGFRLRLFRGGKAGLSGASSFSKDSIESCFRQALHSLNLTDKEEAGESGSPPDGGGAPFLYNPELSSFPISEKIRLAKSMAQAAAGEAGRAARSQPAISQVSDTEIDMAFASSAGGAGRYRRNGVLAYSQALASEKAAKSGPGRKALGFAESSGRSCGGIDFPALGREAGEKSLKKLNFSVPPTGRFPVVFKAGPAAGALLDFLLQHLSGRAVWEGRSLLGGSLGKQLLSQNLTLYDDPMAPWGLRSRLFDGEGFRCKKNCLVEKGAVRRFLTDSFCAKALKAPHTASAVWREDGRLGAEAANIVMAEGKSSFSDLLKESPRTIVIDWLKGLAGYNPISGDFSIESEGFLWERREARPLCRFAVSGNLIAVFAGILKTAGDSLISEGRTKAPSFLCQPLSIAGQ